MPNNSVFDDLSESEISFIDEAIKAHKFKNLDGLVLLFQENGLEISRSAVWRRSSKLKKKLQRLKDAVDMTKQMSSGTLEDEKASLAEGTLSMINLELFEFMDNLEQFQFEDDPEKRMKLIQAAARSASELSRSSISIKKYKQEVITRLNSAATKVAETAKRNGLSADVVNDIKREILGVAS